MGKTAFSTMQQSADSFTGGKVILTGRRNNHEGGDVPDQAVLYWCSKRERIQTRQHSRAAWVSGQ